MILLARRGRDLARARGWAFMAAEATSTLAGAGALAQPHRAALTGPTGEPASNCGTRSGRAALGACFNPEQHPAFHDEGAGSDSAIQAALAGVMRQRARQRLIRRQGVLVEWLHGQAPGHGLVGGAGGEVVAIFHLHDIEGPGGMRVRAGATTREAGPPPGPVLPRPQLRRAIFPRWAARPARLRWSIVADGRRLVLWLHVARLRFSLVLGSRLT